MTDLKIRRSWRKAPLPSTYQDLPDALRREVNRVLVALDLDPADYLDTELGYLMDIATGTLHELRARIEGAPGLLVVSDA
jgi:hypothetical protein